MKKIKIVSIAAMTTAIIFGSCMPLCAYTKEETVYTKLNLDGSEKTTIVSEHLKSEKEQTIEDVSTLSNIFNVNGDETFKQDGNKITWKNKGNDIYYQGKTDKTLPISMDIVYQLDGKEYSVEDMLGKKGKVTISIHYTNHEKQEINGKELYVPFVVTTGTMLPTDKNRDVTIDHGKVTSNGSNYIVFGLGAPGLAENFHDESLNELSDITIEYQTDSFELNTIMSVCSASILSDTDLDLFNHMDNGLSMVDQLSNAYDKIKSGGQTLNQGMNEFSSKYDMFHSGVNQLDSKSGELVSGVKSISTGVNDLNQYLSQLNTGLSTISQNSESIRQGAKAVLLSSLQSVNTQLQSLLTTLNAADPSIPLTLTSENYATVLTTIVSNYGSLPSVAPYVNAINGAKAQLDSIHQFYQGVISYSQGVDMAASNTTKIKGGADTLAAGTNSLLGGTLLLFDGTAILSKNSGLLHSAAKQLCEGTSQLVNGLNQFDEEGLSKITTIINDKILPNIDTVKDLEEILNQYKTFAGSADDIDASTKFIMIVDSKKK